MLWVAVVSASALLGLLIYTISVYNNLVRSSRLVDQTFSNIDVVLKQRRDEVPIVEVLKGYMAHEREVLEEISRIRAGYGDARTTDEKIGIENLLTQALGFLRASFEAYPDLKAIQSVRQVQDETGRVLVDPEGAVLLSEDGLLSPGSDPRRNGPRALEKGLAPVARGIRCRGEASLQCLKCMASS